MSHRIMARIFADDLAYCIALSDARKRENAAARERAMSDQSLVDRLIDDAHRRGLSSIDWAEYFRNVGL